ncbi:unnamed protein product [Lymnaea stagnalis]|uniref:Uncharacterized protein n=1 Tax=Lymnaea stagnalis TaxID=6523 RepID=A0AAV2H7A8_LYMST
MEFVLIILLLASARLTVAQTCPADCYCGEDQVDCYDRQLGAMPDNLSASARYLNLQKNNIKTVDGWKLTGLQGLEHLNLKENQVEELQPESFLNLSSLRNLHLENNNIQNIADNAFGDLPALKVLELSGNQISDISGTFENISSLERLNLNQNKLTSLKDDSFKGVRGLTYLTLAQNKISFISKLAFQGMTILSYLVLRGNPLRNVDGIFTGLEALMFLDVSSCQLSRVPAGLPWPLMTLNLSSNDLLILESRDLEDTQHLGTIILDNNKISVIQDGAFDNKPYLKDIRLNGNKLKQLPYGIPSTVLKFTAENNNILRIFDLNFAHDSTMRVLSLKNNQINDLAAYTFSRLPNLTALFLDQNQITILNNMTFAGLRQLNTLNLEQNPISRIERRAFTSLQRLNYLKLSSTTSNATVLGVAAFQDCPSLISLELMGSPSIVKSILNSKENLHSLQGLKDLNIMNNGLQTLSMDVRMALGNLRTLKLSANPWDCDSHLLYLRKWMSEFPKLFFMLESVTCASPENLKGRSVLDVDPKEFTMATTTEASTTKEITRAMTTTNDENNEDSSKADPQVEKPSSPSTETKLTMTPSRSFNHVESTVSTSFSHSTPIMETTRLITSDIQQTVSVSPATPALSSVQYLTTEYTWEQAHTLIQETVSTAMITQTYSTPEYGLTSDSDEFKQTTRESSTEEPEMPSSSVLVTEGERVSQNETSVNNSDISHSYNTPSYDRSRPRLNGEDNRLPTFMIGGKMQAVIIGVSVSLLSLIAGLIIAVLVVRYKRRQKKLSLVGSSQPAMKNAHETSDTVFIISHMADEPMRDVKIEPRKVEIDNDDFLSTSPVDRKSSASSSSQSSSRKGSRCKRQWSSASSSSRTSFDCIQGQTDDDSELLMHAWK